MNKFQCDKGFNQESRGLRAGVIFDEAALAPSCKTRRGNKGRRDDPGKLKRERTAAHLGHLRKLIDLTERCQKGEASKDEVAGFHQATIRGDCVKDCGVA